jgi:hypothetical protein
MSALTTPLLDEEDFKGCRWIDGEPTPLRAGMFCALPCVPGGSWCQRHHEIVWNYKRERKVGC